MRNKERIKEFGEVFTPLELVNEILDKIPQEELLNPEKTVGDITGCGNGNFLVEVLRRRMEAGISHKDALKQFTGLILCKIISMNANKDCHLGQKIKKFGIF